MPGEIFISYRRADQAWAVLLHDLLKQRGVDAWYDAHVGAGEDWRRVTAKALDDAQIFVLLFSKTASESDDISKELAAATFSKKMVVPVRIEDIKPTGEFLYELASRNWFDAFDDTEARFEILADRLAAMVKVVPAAVIAEPGSGTDASATVRPSLFQPAAWSFTSRRGQVAVGLLAVVVAAVGWLALRPPPAPAHSMTVRMAEFQLLSADLPENLPDTVAAEIAAAFNIDGVVGVSTAPATAPGDAPAYALGGTIQRNGDTIRVITNMVNERSGAPLWSNTFDYDGNELSRVPRHIAVDAGNVVRCGLFGASTYHKPLPDPVLRDYMQFCQGHWDPNTQEGRKALIPAQRVVAALPDFSWGWAAVAGAYWKVSRTAESKQIEEEARASGRAAAERAVQIDSGNSEALYIESMLLERRDWVGREALLKRAIAARRLDCGCEYHQFGWLLVNVGRTAEAVEQLQQANDMLSLYVYTPLNLAQALVVAGKPDEAALYFNAAIDLAPDADFAKYLTMYKATEIGDADLLLDPALPMAANPRAALINGYRALASREPDAKTQAVRDLLALTEREQNAAVAKLLASLGANREAFKIAARIATTQEYPGSSFLWDPSMRQTLADPGFPALAEELGLMTYWKTTQTQPDVCNEEAAPPFCAALNTSAPE